MNTLAFAVIGHLVGDYLLQNDFLAAGKKRSSAICAVHCAIWTLAVIAFAGWWALPRAFPHHVADLPYLWWVPIVLFVTHFIQDRGNLVRDYMRLIGQDAFASPPLGPWSIIAVDNVFHLVVLAIVAWRIG